MSHWRYMMLDGVKFWISYQQLAFLNSLCRLQLIQNSAPPTICWCQCDIRIDVLLSNFYFRAKIDFFIVFYVIQFFSAVATMCKNFKFFLRYFANEKKPPWKQGYFSKIAEIFSHQCQKRSGLPRQLKTHMTQFGMRKGTFYPLSFLDQTLSAEFLPKKSKLFWRWKLTSIGLIWHPDRLINSYKKCL